MMSLLLQLNGLLGHIRRQTRCVLLLWWLRPGAITSQRLHWYLILSVHLAAMLSSALRRSDHCPAFTRSMRCLSRHCSGLRRRLVCIPALMVLVLMRSVLLISYHV